MAIKKDVYSWFQKVGYEKGFGPGEVPASKVKKKQIDTYAILSVVIRKDRKKIFGEDRILEFFYTSDLKITWISSRFSTTFLI